MLSPVQVGSKIVKTLRKRSVSVSSSVPYCQRKCMQRIILYGSPEFAAIFFLLLFYNVSAIGNLWKSKKGTNERPKENRYWAGGTEEERIGKSPWEGSKGAMEEAERPVWEVTERAPLERHLWI
ncbi:hypothetical protein C7M84_015682 [Penaeus vannamei]|uniref:Uncharacterized protein n=1 Tax=Penaeus vannamei TaxID=6689 RepID=A0A3R7PH44_PENVA|nr:hypothetical protein C7M84_015682 [Penaeus vannamei]